MQRPLQKRSFTGYPLRESEKEIAKKTEKEIATSKSNVKETEAPEDTSLKVCYLKPSPRTQQSNLKQLSPKPQVEDYTHRDSEYDRVKKLQETIYGRQKP